MEGLLSNRYELGDILGYGGMSEVRIAVDTVLQREVAVKILRPDLARDPSFLERFRQEAQNSAKLNHPNIVAIYDTAEAETDEGVCPYIVMELIRGQTLRDMVHEDGALYPQRAMHIVSDLCDALDYSHKMGVVHRDVKPGNVMITSTGKVKVMDFGISRVVDAPSAMTATSQVIGTASYLSPEQARGQNVDFRSDIYAAGCVLYEAITGQPPFEGESALSVAYQHVQEDPVPPSHLNELVSAGLDAVVLKAMAKNPEDRYQSAADMEADLVTVLHGQRPMAMKSDATLVQPVLTDEDIARMAAERQAAGVVPGAGLLGAGMLGVGAAGAGAAGAGAAGAAGAGEGSGAGDGAASSATDQPANIGEMMAAAAAAGQANSRQASEDTKNTTADQRKPINEKGVRFGAMRDDDHHPGLKNSAAGAGATATADASGADTAGKAEGDGATTTGDGTDAATSDGADASAHTTNGATSDTKNGKADGTNNLSQPEPLEAPVSKKQSKRKSVRRHFKKLGIALLVLIGLSMTGIVITEAVTGVSIFSNQLAVPDVTNLKANDATDRLRQQGLRVDLQTEASNTVPRGMAIRTDPAASTMVARGGRVTLIVSSGKGPIVVPDVQGMSEEAAREKLTMAGLKVASEVRRVPSDEDMADKVVKLSVPLGSTVSPSQEVTILLGTGDSATFIPSTVGMTEAQARGNLEDAGFSVKVKKIHSSKPKGTVVSTSPKEKANKGDTVTIMVSDGSGIIMPNVRGLSQDEAVRQLRAAGWDGTLSVKKVRTTNFSKSGQVKDQSPEPGSDIPEDGTVVLQVYDVSLF
ncbi:MAG: serine/threonine protein kinase [Corynebacteriales bacterium]|nr:serine/threonine protein kinase [Mycobacteriales bacterium]